MCQSETWRSRIAPLVTRVGYLRSDAPVLVVRLDLEVQVAALRRRLEEGRIRLRRHVEVDVRPATSELDVELARVLVVADELDARRLDGNHPGPRHPGIITGRASIRAPAAARGRRSPAP